jgi:hypothetical protein
MDDLVSYRHIKYIYQDLLILILLLPYLFNHIASQQSITVTARYMTWVVMQVNLELTSPETVTHRI